MTTIPIIWILWKLDAPTWLWVWFFVLFTINVVLEIIKK